MILCTRLCIVYRLGILETIFFLIYLIHSLDLRYDIFYYVFIIILYTNGKYIHNKTAIFRIMPASIAFSLSGTSGIIALSSKDHKVAVMFPYSKLVVILIAMVPLVIHIIFKKCNIVCMYPMINFQCLLIVL